MTYWKANDRSSGQMHGSNNTRYILSILFHKLPLIVMTNSGGNFISFPRKSLSLKEREEREKEKRGRKRGIMTIHFSVKLLFFCYLGNTKTKVESSSFSDHFFTCLFLLCITHSLSLSFCIQKNGIHLTVHVSVCNP